MQDMKKKKNVMLLVALLDQGGLERICALTAKLLSDKCNLTLVVFSTKGMIYDVSGVELVDLNLGAKPGMFRKVFTLWKRIKAIKKIKKEKETEVTYSFGPSANLANIYSKVGDEIWVGIRGYGALEDAGSMKRLCKKADKVVCCSKVMERDVKKRFSPKDTACLYNPCDVESIRRLAEENIVPGECLGADGGPVIASMGREHDVKGFWHLLKAFALVKKEIGNARLMIIGEGNYKEYKKLAEELHVQNSVIFTGVQKNPFAYLQCATVYVLTSSSEGFPNALVEAMALGKPVVSVNCKSGPAEILTEHFEEHLKEDEIYSGEYGLLLPVMNPVKNLDSETVEKEERILAKELIRILNDKECLAKMGQCAKVRSEVFSMERYVEEIMKML